MALSYSMKREIERKVHAGLQMDTSTPEKDKYYNDYKNLVAQQIINKAKAGQPLSDKTPWKLALYNQYAPTNKVQNGEGMVINGNPTSLPTYNNPTWIPSTSPIVSVGEGSSNPLNRLEPNSIVTAVVGIVFIRAIFGIFTKVVK